jgi:hypothetical protein
LYASPNVIRAMKKRKMRWAGNIMRMREMSNSSNILVGKPEGERPVGRPRRRWDYNVRMNRKEMWNFSDWLHLAHGGDQWRVLYRVP